MYVSQIEKNFAFDKRTPLQCLTKLSELPQAVTKDPAQYAFLWVYYAGTVCFHKKAIVTVINKN